MDAEKQKKIDDIWGSAPTQTSSVAKSRAQELRDRAKTGRKIERTANRSLGEKILDFTGGKEIAQGLGQALAMGKNSKDLQAAQQTQIDIQAKLLQNLKDKKVKGEDTTVAQKAVDMITEQIKDFGNEDKQERLLNPNELTKKQVVGDALQLATTASAGKLTSANASKMPGVGVGVVKGALKGAATGASSGAIVGGSEGIARGLQEDKDTKGILKSGATGAVIGGVTGGVIGGTVGAVSGGSKANKLKKPHLDAVTPDTKNMGAEEYKELVRKGRISPKTSSNPDKYILSKEEIATADKYKSLLGKDPVKNTHNLINEIEKKDVEVGKFLREKNSIFNKGELKNYLKSSIKDIDDLTIDEKRIAKLKQSTIDNFIKGLKKNDMESLWQARKTFDRTIEKSFTGAPSFKKELSKEFRNSIQDFISQRTDDVTYKEYMKEMRQLFNLADVTDHKAYSEKGINAIQKWIKHNPTKAKTIGIAAGSGVLGTIGVSMLKD